MCDTVGEVPTACNPISFSTGFSGWSRLVRHGSRILWPEDLAAMWCARLARGSLVP